jgi:hypothetical protein
MLVDEFLPVFDVSDSVAVVVHADVATTWRELLEIDLIDVGRRRPIVAALGALRMLPEIVSHLLHGEAPAEPPSRMRLTDMSQLPMNKGGWVLLGEVPFEQIALGLVGKFWRPVIEFATVTRPQFREFSTPGFAKTVYALSVSRIDSHRTLLTATMRTATTDAHARRWFWRYWTFGVGSGAHVLVHGLVDLVREKAEQLAIAGS